ncbi:MAG: protein kinase, partial [Pirellulaceae bacterium]|nr:protein kinase [Pirellulaceae bacterium]
MTADHTILGTPNYMSPEQANGKPVDARTDIYSLGVVLYEMLTGAPPFKGKTSFEILRQHIESSVPPPSEIRPDVPEAFDAVVARAVAKSPDDRYQDVRQMAADLAQVCPSETLERRGNASGVGTEPTALMSRHGAPFESTVRLKQTASCPSASSGHSYRWFWAG